MMRRTLRQWRRRCREQAWGYRRFRALPSLKRLPSMVLFVASDDASFSTGSEFIADGGLLLGPVPQHERAEATVASASARI